MHLYCTLEENVIQCLEFSMEFQSNKLIYQKEYTKRQQIIYLLIHHLHDREGWGYRKISNWLNKNINDLLSFSVFFLINEFVGLEFHCEL